MASLPYSDQTYWILMCIHSFTIGVLVTVLVQTAKNSKIVLINALSIVIIISQIFFILYTTFFYLDY